jgi:hypothetical protein
VKDDVKNKSESATLLPNPLASIFETSSISTLLVVGKPILPHAINNV